MTSRPFSRLRPVLLVAALAATQLGATDCGGGVIDDPGFDLWCGPTLCSWMVERGEIRSVPTWHRGDRGVEMIGLDTAIAQVSRSGFGDTCLRFAMLADVEDTAEVMLELDLEGDGTVEHLERVAGTHFTRIEFLLALAGPLDAVRFRLTKRGPGRAVLADIDAERADFCPGTPIASEPPAAADDDAEVHGTVDGSGGRP